jgi:hypothetical protein
MAAPSVAAVGTIGPATQTTFSQDPLELRRSFGKFSRAIPDNPDTVSNDDV